MSAGSKGSIAESAAFDGFAYRTVGEDHLANERVGSTGASRDRAGDALGVGKTAMPHELGLELVVVALELGDTLRLQPESLLGQDALRRQLFVARASALVDHHRHDARDRPDARERHHHRSNVHTRPLLRVMVGDGRSAGA